MMATHMKKITYGKQEINFKAATPNGYAPVTGQDVNEDDWEWRTVTYASKHNTGIAVILWPNKFLSLGLQAPALSMGDVLPSRHRPVISNSPNPANEQLLNWADFRRDPY